MYAVRNEPAVVPDHKVDDEKSLDPSGPASGAPNAVGRPAMTTIGPVTAATSGIRSTQEECAPPAFISGLRHSASRVAGGRRIRIGM
jgi:hypothetical protein